MMQGFRALVTYMVARAAGLDAEEMDTEMEAGTLSVCLRMS